MRALLLGLPAVASASHAESVAQRDEPPASHGDPLSAYEGWKGRLRQKGLTFDLNYTSEDLVAVRGGNSDAVVHAGQLSFTGQADMDRLAGWGGAAITLSVSKRDGQGINTRSGIGALLGPQEIYGRGNVTRISQFWLDQDLAGKRLSIRIGRVNPGSDFEEFDCNFINLSYCGNQVGNIVSDYWYNYPISQWGAIAKARIGGTTSFKVGAYQVNPNNLKLGFFSPFDPSHGTGTLIPFEFGWTPLRGAAGNTTLKLGGWYSTAARNDVYLDRNRASAAQTAAPFLERSGSYGGYASFVARMPIGERDGPGTVMVFANATLADTRTSLVDQSFAAGIVYTGALAARPKDEIGIAVSYNHLNQRVADYRRERLLNGTGTDMPGVGENVVELYYGIQVTRFLKFRPDIQWIRRPGGIAANRDAIITGARTSIGF
ncbi:carbohydrate porin [Sphingomonas sp. AP4-R1]|uniref:carbohydrate porin n=1 Tax=Sphingomonas sp. AP4-R1 TaxID=2735134 RepID=UPI001493A1E1|nr:carbohydrate porin [Sphingomonas sp. AP4-R1]QJU57908.1 carbohydrate porin [Sphingomonas sp. AP4-R1]